MEDFIKNFNLDVEDQNNRLQIISENTSVSGHNMKEFGLFKQIELLKNSKIDSTYLIIRQY